MDYNFTAPQAQRLETNISEIKVGQESMRQSLAQILQQQSHIWDKLRDIPTKSDIQQMLTASKGGGTPTGSTAAEAESGTMGSPGFRVTWKLLKEIRERLDETRPPSGGGGGGGGGGSTSGSGDLSSIRSMLASVQGDIEEIKAGSKALMGSTQAGPTVNTVLTDVLTNIREKTEDDHAKVNAERIRWSHAHEVATPNRASSPAVALDASFHTIALPSPNNNHDGAGTWQQDDVHPANILTASLKMVDHIYVHCLFQQMQHGKEFLRTKHWYYFMSCMQLLLAAFFAFLVAIIEAGQLAQPVGEALSTSGGIFSGVLVLILALFKWQSRMESHKSSVELYTRFLADLALFEEELAESKLVGVHRDKIEKEVTNFKRLAKAARENCTVPVSKIDVTYEQAIKALEGHKDYFHEIVERQERLHPGVGMDFPLRRGLAGEANKSRQSDDPRKASTEDSRSCCCFPRRTSKTVPR